MLSWEMLVARVGDSHRGSDRVHGLRCCLSFVSIRVHRWRQTNVFFPSRPGSISRDDRYLMLGHKITPDLELRLLQLADAKTLFGVVEANRAYLREWLAWVDGTKKLRDAEKFISAGLREYATAQAFSSGIWSAGRFVGVIGHNRIDWGNRMANPGWWLIPEAQGRGIMTQCCKVVFAHAFNQLQLARICVGVATGNLHGQTFVKKLGFTQISTLRNAERLNGRSVDHFIYSLTADPSLPASPLR